MLSSWERHSFSADTIICRWFGEFPARRLEEKLEYRDSSGVDCTATAAGAFEFLFLHQTHHRREIAQILDSIGIYNNPLSNITYLES